MSMPYIGEIRMFGGNFAPLGWEFCNGQLLSIAENETLFNLIGTTYGGDGQNTFALPDLRGRLPLHFGQGPGQPAYVLSESGGSEEVTLTQQQIPSHSHMLVANKATGTEASPQNHVLASAAAGDPYFASQTPPPSTELGPNAIQVTGGSQPHNNMAPYLAVSFIISLYGIYPSPT
ncbi:phage tail protein [Stappia sp. 28M-7]|jgi:microcystin-dependent protein|uniref:phage tail protein n=1 Tax=Stappia sp. 28M-7 TaxID=2762596 RepID=UPI000E7456D7|nr:tail fiber protein [Stappia sp. 28M-7]MBC2857773.1 phage tail protein [Stappia sp. 28M-7]